MKAKELNLVINDKEHLLNFGVNWFYEYYLNDSGHDLISNPTFEGINLVGTQIFKTVKSLVWAAIQADCSMKNEASTITGDEVFNWVMSNDIDFVTELMTKVIDCISGTSEKKDSDVLDSAEKKNQQVGVN